MSNTFTKDQLQAMTEQELRQIALMATPAAAYLDDRDSLIYAILDAQAVSLSVGGEKVARRPRIGGRSTDHVYQATQTGEGARFDTPQEERALKRSLAAKERAAEAEATKALLGENLPLELPKRKRGRPTKAEAEARKQQEAALREALLLRKTQVPLEQEDSSGLDTPPAAPPMSLSPTPMAEKPQAEATSDFIVAKIEDLPSGTISSESDNANEKKASFPQTLQEDLRPLLTPEVKKRVAEQLAAGHDLVVLEDVPQVEQIDFSEFGKTPLNEKSINGKVAPFKSDPLERFRKLTLEHSQTAQTSLQAPKSAIPPAPALPELLLDSVGVLEIDNQGVGFLRSADYNYMPSPDDVYVSAAMVRQCGLRMGDTVEGKVRVPRGNEKHYILSSIVRVNGLEPEALRERVAFEHLIPLFPEQQYRLSTQPNAPLACRIVDLFSPIGKGQRALIVAQPKTGKTMLMKQIANAIAANHPEAYLMMLLIDERPEEVTDIARTVKAEVIASTFDEPAAHHVRIAQMVLEKAKRLVECGHDVVIFLDSITRLARAFNTTAPTSGKILTGGVDAHALQKPKRFFGAARNIEGGGSLTIVATALIDTGSKMDEVIFEEFKGTGNMELQLDRSLANKRIFPAVNLTQSSTRRDDLLLDETTLNRMHIVRNYMADMNSVEAMNFLKKRLEDTHSNEEFIQTMER